MAKYERVLTGDFDEFLHYIEGGILSGSATVHLEDSSNMQLGDVHCAVRVFERYSIAGKTRLSMSVTLLGRGKGRTDDLHLCAITSGGSGAVLFKLNRIGEGTFLDNLIELVNKYNSR